MTQIPKQVAEFLAGRRFALRAAGYGYRAGVSLDRITTAIVLLGRKTSMEVRERFELAGKAAPLA